MIESLTMTEKAPADTKAGKDAIRVTQLMLSRLGMQIDLTSPGKVNFPQMAKIIEEDRRQAVATNELARTIIERDLPLTPASNLFYYDGVVYQGLNGPKYAVSFDIGEKFLRISPNSIESREVLSYASILLFRNLFKLAVDSKAQRVKLSKEDSVVTHFRENMIKGIKSSAKGARKKDILELASEMEEKTANIDELAITGIGGDLELCVNGSPIYRVQSGNANTLVLLETMMELEYYEQMSIRTSWFISPEVWTLPDSNKFTEAASESLATAREIFPHWELPAKPREILTLFLTGELARRSLIQLAKEKGMELQESPQLTDEEVGSGDMDRQKKKKKKKKKTAPPPKPMSLKRIAREPRPEPVVEKIPMREIKYNAPAPVVFETSEVKRLRLEAEADTRKKRAEARREVDRQERLARVVEERRADRAEGLERLSPLYTEPQPPIRRKGPKKQTETNIESGQASDEDQGTPEEDIFSALNDILLDINAEKNRGTRIGEVFPKEPTEE